MGRKSIHEEPEKPHRLSLAELAAHDDACSDAMVDNAYFKSQIRKNRTKYTPLRGIKEDQVPQILLHKVIVAKDLTVAEKEILQIPGIKRYRSTLRSKPEKVNFRAHLQKYIAMYMTDCPWEVSTTNRYTITTYEASVTARQRIRQGQVIKYLTGTLVPLTMEESADLDLTNRNFSIVVSSRKKNSSIFLGPARFANHDCDANGRLVTRGTDGMEVMAVKNIEIGDEITVSYGDDYFGPGNMDCLCHTCERLVRNGWAASKGIDQSRATSVHSSNGLSSPEPSRTKRKRETELLSDHRSSKLPRLKASPSKLHQSWTPPVSADSDSIEDVATVQQDAINSSDGANDVVLHGAEMSPPSSPSRAIQPVPVLVAEQASGQLPTEQTFSDSLSNSVAARLLNYTPMQHPYPSPVSGIDSTAENDQPEEEDDPDTIVIKVESVETSKVETDRRQTTALAHAPFKTPAARTLTNVSATIASKLKGGQVDELVPSIEATTNSDSAPTTTAKVTVQTIFDCIRIPGDYLLTRKLLAQPHDRWVQCHNERCHSYFVQPNGYQTRRECPRCERHSMLYGYSWPKTDPDPRKILERGGGSGRGRGKQSVMKKSAYSRAGRSGKGSWVIGGGDEEERVMDHRTVHRFVLPEDEKATTRKGLLRMADVARKRGDDLDVYEGGNVGRAMTTESGGFDSDRSLTPDGEARRRSNRFVAAKVYTDV